jgi:hypothetical protein
LPPNSKVVAVEDNYASKGEFIVKFESSAKWSEINAYYDQLLVPIGYEKLNTDEQENEFILQQYLFKELGVGIMVGIVTPPGSLPHQYSIAVLNQDR